MLLSINQELLYESIQLQQVMHDMRKEAAAAAGEGGGAPDQNRKPTPEEAMAHQDYTQYVFLSSSFSLISISSVPAKANYSFSRCMRRLQGNLSYLAALADRKASIQIPPCPSYLTPPPLNRNLKIKNPPAGSDSNDRKTDPIADREERIKLMTELYTKLQSLFPGVDPKREPAFQPQRPQGHYPGTGQGPGQKVPGSHGSPVASHSQGPMQTPTNPTMSDHQSSAAVLS